MGAISNSHQTVPLSDEEKKSWLDAIVKMDDIFLPAKAWQGAGAEHKHVFVASFDGTWNDRENLRPGEAMTNPALLEKELSKLYSDRLDGHYYNGVGTRENAVLRIIDGMTGNGSEQRAEQAFNDFQQKSLEWLKENPEAQIHVVAIGFSRGAASARHFLNLVDERGVPADGGRQYTEDNPYSESQMDSKTYQIYDKFKRPPGTVTSSALLYDTVATGQESVLKMGIPASTSFVVHLTSHDEDRRSFPLTSIDGRAPDEANAARLLTIELPGVHSDIGGGYQEGVGKLGHYLGDQVLYRLGFEIEPGLVPREALEEGRHQHHPTAGSVQDMGAPEDEYSEGGSRRTKYVANETLTELQRTEVITENRESELEAGVRYVEALQKGTAPPDPLGYENLGVVLTPHPDGSVEVLLSNPAVIQFDESTNSISVHGHVVHTLSEEDHSSLKAGLPVVEVFTIAPEHAFSPADAKQSVLEDLPKVGASEKQPTHAKEPEAREIEPTF